MKTQRTEMQMFSSSYIFIHNHMLSRLSFETYLNHLDNTKYIYMFHSYFFRKSMYDGDGDFLVDHRQFMSEKTPILNRLLEHDSPHINGDYKAIDKQSSDLEPIKIVKGDESPPLRFLGHYF